MLFQITGSPYLSCLWSPMKTTCNGFVETRGISVSGSLHIPASSTIHWMINVPAPIRRLPAAEHVVSMTWYFFNSSTCVWLSKYNEILIVNVNHCVGGYQSIMKFWLLMLTIVFGTLAVHGYRRFFCIKNIIKVQNLGLRSCTFIGVKFLSYLSSKYQFQICCDLGPLWFIIFDSESSVVFQNGVSLRVWS